MPAPRHDDGAPRSPSAVVTFLNPDFHSTLNTEVEQHDPA